MNDEIIDETREFWDRVAADWDIQVGDTGDRNRMLTSDPVLWSFVGAVSGLAVLDAGCGEGYMARELASQGADVLGVDSSANLIEAAAALTSTDGHAPRFLVSDVADLDVDSDSYDLVLCNHLMNDLRDPSGAIKELARAQLGIARAGRKATGAVIAAVRTAGQSRGRRGARVVIEGHSAEG